MCPGRYGASLTLFIDSVLQLDLCEGQHFSSRVPDVRASLDSTSLQGFIAEHPLVHAGVLSRMRSAQARRLLLKGKLPYAPSLRRVRKM